MRPLSDGPAPRRWMRYLNSQVANRRLLFTFTALALLAAKFVHIYAHASAVPSKTLSRWAFSLFAQDVGLIIAIRTLLDPRTSRLWLLFRIPLHLFTTVVVAFNTALAVISITFYSTTKSEIHWRNLGLVSDASSRALVLSGTISFVCVVTANLLLSWLLQNVCFGLFGYATDMAIGIFALPWYIVRLFYPRKSKYLEIPQQDVESAAKESYDDSAASESSGLSDRSSRPPLFLTRLLQALLSLLRIRITISTAELILKTFIYMGVLGVLLAITILAFKRPNEATLTFLSWTTALLPFVDISSTSPVLQNLKPIYAEGLENKWNNLTALTPPVEFEWLTTNEPLTGFEDWFMNGKHYNAVADPMRVSNLDEPVITSLQESLEDIKVRHVLFVALESTRNDVFPLKKDGLIWNRIADTYSDKEIPDDVEEFLSNLTPNAKYITGDYDDGFDPDSKKPQPKRGGINFSNAYTTATYTLKSLVGSICGITPLVADFNLDHLHHPYQPCLPHIFEALNQIDHSDDDESGPFANAKWQSYFFQTATLQFDSFDKLMAKIGFPENNTIDTEYLRSKNAKHGPVSNPNTNYFGFEEEPLEDYIRDAFTSAKENNERVFLSHITSTTHHPFVLPESEEKVTLGKGLDDISDYVNTVGYVDKWLKKLMDLLEELEVADETLIIFTGDHGLTMPENDKLSTYYNPGNGANHVPLVVSHPKLPAITVDDPVSSSQILPTILDMLLETKSLDKTSSRAANDLVNNYEGQSLIRPLQFSSNETGEGNWQFVVINPGRGMVSVRDTRDPEWNFVAPLVENVEWGLTNIHDDPREQHTVQAMSFNAFLQDVEQTFGVERAKWAEEAAFKVRWWFEDNNKRWRYGLYAAGEQL